MGVALTLLSELVGQSEILDFDYGSTGNGFSLKPTWELVVRNLSGGDQAAVGALTRTHSVLIIKEF